MATDHVEVTSADIARIAGVRPTAVSNWRRRHDDFPKPVGGTDRNPRFALAHVEDWLKRQGRATGISAQERLWQAFESTRGTVSPEDALAMVGMLLLHLRQHPDTAVPSDAVGWSRLLTQAEHTFVTGSGVGAGVADLAAHLPPVDFVRLATLLTVAAAVVAGSADREAAETIFESLCSRFLDSTGRSGLAATPPELAALMVELAGKPSGALVDLACGTGTLLLAALDQGYDRVHGQELDPSVARIAALRLAFAALRDTSLTFDIRADNSLLRPAYPRSRAGAVVSNPPFAERNWGYDELMHDPGWEYGVPPRMESELAWAQRALAQVVPGGAVVLLMPPGVAFRPSGRRIRRELLTRGALRAVISLPPGLAAHYSLALQIWILRRPDGSTTPTHVLMVDTAGEHGGSDPARRNDLSMTWAQVHQTVTQAWPRFVTGPEEVPERVGIVRAVPLPDVLDEEVDLSPRRNLPLPPRPSVSPHDLTAARQRFARLTSDLDPSVTDLAHLPELASGAGRAVPLGELGKTGVVFIRRSMSSARTRGREEDQPAFTIEGRILTARDLVAGKPASTTGDVDGDEVRNPPIRVGDVLVPAVARRLVARVANPDDVGCYPSASVYVVRTDASVLDPWFLAGYLSSTDGARQAERVGSSLGGDIRIDLRRVRVPLMPVDTQRAYGGAFRRLAEFTHTLRAAHDAGIELAQNATDAIVMQLVTADDQLPALP